MYPSTAGRSCQFRPRSGLDMADKVATFEEYARSLEVRCEAGRPATLQWTVQPDTPDTVYYQVRRTEGLDRTHTISCG